MADQWACKWADTVESWEAGVVVVAEVAVAWAVEEVPVWVAGTALQAAEGACMAEEVGAWNTEISNRCMEDNKDIAVRDTEAGVGVLLLEVVMAVCDTLLVMVVPLPQEVWVAVVPVP